MNRTELVKKCLSAVNAQSYLEVGVSKGQNFLSIECAKKVAVDPKFRFGWQDVANSDHTANFYQITSDEFFSSESIVKEKFDVIFLDGLHTAEQTLRDFINAIEFLSEGGVIVIDDVLPDSYLSSLRIQSQADESKAQLGIRDRGWMGDVYRIVPFIETFFQQYSFSLPQESGKCLVVWKSTRNANQIVDRTLEEVGRFAYENTVLKSDFYNQLPMESILDRIKIARNEID